LGVISYRLVNFWLPIPIGGISYLSLRWGSSRHRHPEVGAGQLEHGETLVHEATTSRPQPAD
jgi:hypothetical protein